MAHIGQSRPETGQSPHNLLNSLGSGHCCRCALSGQPSACHREKRSVCCRVDDYSQVGMLGLRLQSCKGTYSAMNPCRKGNYIIGGMQGSCARGAHRLAVHLSGPNGVLSPSTCRYGCLTRIVFSSFLHVAASSPSGWLPTSLGHTG